MIKIDLNEVQKNNEMMQNINEEITSTNNSVIEELRKISDNIGSISLRRATRDVINDVSKLTTTFKSNMDSLYDFVKRQLSSYTANNDEARTELLSLIALLDACFDEDGNIINSYEQGDFYSKYGTEGVDVVNRALEYVGGSYVYGGQVLTENGGVDCSGFVREIYEQFGYQLGTTTYDQVYNGDAVDISGYNYSNMLPGDLVFYGPVDAPTHVAIYMGDMQIVHAATTSKGICTEGMLWNYPSSVRRIIGSTNVSMVNNG